MARWVVVDMKQPSSNQKQFVSFKLPQLAPGAALMASQPASMEQLQAGAVTFLRARLGSLLHTSPIKPSARSDFTVITGIVLVLALQIQEFLIAEACSVDRGFAMRSFRTAVEEESKIGDSLPLQSIVDDAQSFANSLISASEGPGGAKMLLQEIKAVCLAALHYEGTDAAQLTEVDTAISEICQSILRRTRH